MNIKSQILALLSFCFFAVPVIAENSTANSNFTILDVRTTEEFQESHLKEAVHVDFLKPDFKEKISKLDKQKTYKLYCRSGNRSGKALEIMKAQGFQNVENLGSLKQASQKLNRTCEGKQSC